MPELPEVETVRRGLAAQLTGRVITGLSYLEWPRTIEAPAPAEFQTRLAERAIQAVRRRAKFLVLDLDGDEHLLIHLRMTGQLRVVPRATPRDRFDRVAFALAGDDELRFNDIRRFGRIGLYRGLELARRLRALGPEPLGDTLDAATFAARLRSRRTRLKPLLLDQSFLAGLGNIYVDEALHRAGLHPLTVANQLATTQAETLYHQIRAVLAEALASGGTTFANYRDAYGEAGDYYERRRVYGRTGEPCATCGATIVRLVVGGRGTHLCPNCQPPPAGEATETRPLVALPPRRLRRAVAEAPEPYGTDGGA